MSVQVSGTEGYAEEARELFKQYESVHASEAHRAVLHLIPPVPGSILDIGSGTGRDAAWFAAQGHRVVAVEPTDAMRICIPRQKSNGSTTACRILLCCGSAARGSIS